MTISKSKGKLDQAPGKQKHNGLMNALGSNISSVNLQTVFGCLVCDALFFSGFFNRLTSSNFTQHGYTSRFALLAVIFKSIFSYVGHLLQRSIKAQALGSASWVGVKLPAQRRRELSAHNRDVATPVFSLSQNYFILLFLCVPCALCGEAQAQNPPGPPGDYNISHLNFVLIDPPQPVPPTTISASKLDNPGPCSYHYWVVAHSLVGNATPSGPAPVFNAACTLVNGNRISWNSVTGATSYDVLRTPTPAPPTGACNCAVATGVSAATVTDTGALSSYTVTTLDPNTLLCIMDNEAIGPAASQLVFNPPTCLITGAAGTGPPYKVASSTHTIVGDGSDEVVFTCPLTFSCDFVEYFSANQVLTPGKMVTGIFGASPVIGFHSTKLKRGSTTYLLDGALIDSIINAGQRQINMEPGDQYIVNFTNAYAGDPFLFAVFEAPLSGPLRFHMPIVPAQSGGVDTVVYTDPTNFEMIANGQAFTPLDIAAVADFGGGESATDLVWNNLTGNTQAVSYTFKWNSATTLTVSDIIGNTGGSQFIVQSASGFANGAASPAVAFPSNNIAGNLLWVAIGSDATITAPTDSQGNTYTLAVTAGKAAIYFATPAKAGANTVTCNHTGSTGSTHCHIAEISGLLNSPLDQVGSVASSATCSVTSGATTAANEFVAAFFYDGVSNKTLTAGTGYTQIQQTNNGVGNSAFSENSNFNGAGPQIATCSGNSTDALSQLITTFKAVAVYTPISTWEGPVVLSPGDKVVFNHNAPAGTTVFINFLTWIQK